MELRLGDYLKQLRETAKLTQKETANKVTARGGRLTQASLAQYETGRITFPDPTVLKILADVYQADYWDIAFRVGLAVVFSKYSEEAGISMSDKATQRLNLWVASLEQFETVGGVPGLEEHQLRAKAKQVCQKQMLDVEGMTQWQKNFPDLESLWIVAPDFLDDYDETIREAVIHNLKRPGFREYIYFVRPEDMFDDGRFSHLQELLIMMDPDVTTEIIKDKIIGIPLTPDELRFLNADMAIANGDNPRKAVGFSFTKDGNKPDIATMMPRAQLEDAIRKLSGWINKRKQKNKVVAMSTMRQNRKRTT